jgi:uncharacterized protein (DUF4415 family)
MMKKLRESSARGARAGKKERGTKSTKINFSDIPELSDKQLSRMRRVGRPTVGDEPRKLIAIRLDPKVLGWLRKTAEKKGLPYQSLVNEILAEEMRKAS